MKIKKSLADLGKLLGVCDSPPSDSPTEVPETSVSDERDYIRLGSVLYQVKDCIDVTSAHNGQTRRMVRTQEGRSFFVCEEGKKWHWACQHEWDEHQSSIAFSKEMSLKELVRTGGQLSGGGGSETSSGDVGGTWGDKGYF